MLNNFLDLMTSHKHPIIHQSFSLLLMDTLIIYLKSCKVLPEVDQKTRLENCRELFASFPVDEKDSPLILKLKRKAEEYIGKIEKQK